MAGDAPLPCAAASRRWLTRSATPDSPDRVTVRTRQVTRRCRVQPRGSAVPAEQVRPSPCCRLACGTISAAATAMPACSPYPLVVLVKSVATYLVGGARHSVNAVGRGYPRSPALLPSPLGWLAGGTQAEWHLRRGGLRLHACVRLTTRLAPYSKFITIRVSQAPLMPTAGHTPLSCSAVPETVTCEASWPRDILIPTLVAWSFRELSPLRDCFVGLGRPLTPCG